MLLINRHANIIFRNDYAHEIFQRYPMLKTDEQKLVISGAKQQKVLNQAIKEVIDNPFQLSEKLYDVIVDNPDAGTGSHLHLVVSPYSTKSLYLEPALRQTVPVILMVESSSL